MKVSKLKFELISFRLLNFECLFIIGLEDEVGPWRLCGFEIYSFNNLQIQRRVLNEYYSHYRDVKFHVFTSLVKLFILSFYTFNSIGISIPQLKLFITF